MSLITRIRLSAEMRMTAQEVLLSSSRVKARRSAMPMTPFIGLRISWLMVARNMDLARLASSAESRASSNWAWPLSIWSSMALKTVHQRANLIALTGAARTL